MRWKITGRFLTSTIAIVIIVLIVNTAIAIAMLLHESKQATTNDVPEDFTRRFADRLIIENETVKLSTKSKQALDDHDSFLQVLDRNGREIYHYKTPKALPTKYTPTLLIQYYKYQELPNTTIFFGDKDGYSYLIGMNNSNYDRYVFTADMETIALKIGRYLLIFLLADILIALIIGIFFGHILTKPLHYLIDGIHKLRSRQFNAMPIRKGVYKEVFVNMNALARTLEAYEEAQKQHEKMRDEWISNISHDMKTPLASIQGYAELMQYADSVEEAAEYSTIIESKSKYMRELLDDLNLTMKLRNNALPLQLASTNVVHFTREIVIDVLNDELYGERDVTFVAAMEALDVTLDQKLMKRALLNFIYNAFIHNDDDVSVTVTVDTRYPQHIDIAEEEKLSTARVCIIIQDNGHGIKADELENIFERYYRGTNTTNTRGTGLGTAIARDIIEAHDGRVHLRSTVNVGTTIIIALP